MGSIYTRTGDTGTTFNGVSRVAKNSSSINLLGDIDELMCTLGLAKGYADVSTRKFLEEIQFQLYIISGYISVGSQINLFLYAWTRHLEHQIDEWQSELPELTEFIRPTGYIQLSRAVCRRAERSLVTWISNTTILSDELSNLIAYFNRLSDWLFVLARVTDQLV